MRLTHVVLACGVLFSGAAGAAPLKDLSGLKLFKTKLAGKGMWKMEFLESSDPKLKEGAELMKGAAVCIDLTGDVSRVDAQFESCKPEIVSDTATAAEVKMLCDDGVPTRIKVSKESDTSFVFQWWRTPKDGPQQSVKMRQTYAGECKEGAPRMVLDKNSEACKMMKAQLGDNPMAVCASLPPAQRGPCETQMKQALAMCQ